MHGISWHADTQRDRCLRSVINRLNSNKLTKSLFRRSPRGQMHNDEIDDADDVNYNLELQAFGVPSEDELLFLNSPNHA